jgi:hypothetical protein
MITKQKITHNKHDGHQQIAQATIARATGGLFAYQQQHNRKLG